MARGTRRHIRDDDDDDDDFDMVVPKISPQPRRSRRRNISYNEDSDRLDLSEADESKEEVKEEVKEKAEEDILKDIGSDAPGIVSDDVPSEPDNENKDETYDDKFSDNEDESRPRKRRRRVSSRPPVRGEGEDSDFRADDVSDDDVMSDDASSAEFDDMAELQRLRERQFVATDDEDDSIHTRRRRQRQRQKSRRQHHTARKPRGRPPSRHNVPDDDEDNDNDNDNTIQQEIKDLYDSSPDASPVRHKLRERERKIDYTIPSLLTHENENELYAAAHTGAQQRPKRGRRLQGTKAEFRNLLFPTAGPFGGSDVLSLMGQNIPPGGIPIPGMAAGHGLSMSLANDSDSSDDDLAIAPASMGNSGAMSQFPGLSNMHAPNDLGSGNILNNTTIRGAQVGGKKKNSLSDTDPLGVDMNIDFSAVGGLDNYIDQLKEMVALPLLYPELYQNFSITPPRGVLFHGPPGTGKTLMARALAASCSTPSRKITFFMRKGADCLSKWVGEAERQLRLLFEEAKNQQPSIIFFDEIDGLAPVRSSKQEQIHASIVSTLLALMDGMDNRGQVIVIGATNRPDSVDPALRRPGRFDREFYFPLPDLHARKHILQIHTNKWIPPLAPVFIDKIAALTKGYGGADMRALCTEAALNAIQRKYPQIYKASEKLIVHPSKVKVVAKDFMRALEKIVPSSARSTSTGSAPIPERLQPLLQESLDEVSAKLNSLLPGSVAGKGAKKLTNLEEAMYLDPTINDEDGGFSKHEFLRNLESSRICKPHLLLSGERGAGQQYLGSAILNFLEGFQVQNLDLATIFSDVTRTPESCIVQAFTEARRNQPSIVFISNIDTWYDVMPHSAKATLAGLLRNLKSNEKILFLGIAEKAHDELDPQMKADLGFLNGQNNIELHNPSTQARQKFFMDIKNALLMKPYEFLNDLENRPKRKLKTLKPAPLASIVDPKLSKKKIKQQIYDDTKLKNVLKLKLAGIMDLFKNRYKRFKKPIIDESLLHHLFDPSILENSQIPYEVLYVKGEDPDHSETIKELATGKHFYNMDLDTIEERIWNGFYSEAKQFMRDIRMIVKDAITSSDRERILKANEMLTNAQFGIDDFNNAEFAGACKQLREREVAKQTQLLADYHKLKGEFEKKQQELLSGFDQNSQLPNGNSSSASGEQNGHVDMGTNEIDTLASTTVVESIVENKTIIESHDDTMKNISETPTLTHEEVVKPVQGSNGEVPEIQASTTLSNKSNGHMSTLSVNSTSMAPEQENNDLNDSSSSSEAEDDHLIDLDQSLNVPANVDKLFAEEMVNATSGFTIERLEFFVARLMEIIWEDRSSWDKTSTVAKLRSVTEELSI